MPPISPIKGKKRAFSAQASHEMNELLEEQNTQDVQDLTPFITTQKKQKQKNGFKHFQVKVLKEAQFDVAKSIKEKRARDAKVELESKEKTRANKILMEHGVTASQSL